MDRPKTAEQSSEVVRREAGWQPVEHDGTLQDSAHSRLKCNTYTPIVNFECLIHEVA